MESLQKNGFILLLGETNVGKSTFVNSVIKDKVSIVSRKVQTTRDKVLGIFTDENYQIIFVDTPGIFIPRRNYDRKMIQIAMESTKEVDMIMLMIDAQKGITKILSKVISELPKNKKVFCVINKVDLIKKEDLLTLSGDLATLFDFDKFFMISALKQKGIEDILNYIKANLDQEGFVYEEDQISDMPINKLATEITREKIYNLLHQEIPYNIVVEGLHWKETDSSISIYQNILIKKQNYKPIILGKNSEKIKQIRITAQQEMEHLFGKKVLLNLYIKTDKKIMS